MLCFPSPFKECSCDSEDISGLISVFSSKFFLEMQITALSSTKKGSSSRMVVVYGIHDFLNEMKFGSLFFLFCLLKGMF
jgi:hypothetical protein